MKPEEINNYVEQMKKEQIKKLTDVGFTEEQAKVLLDIMQTKALSGGMF
jgi:hypothetical protein